jgi:hypothetical protein
MQVRTTLQAAKSKQKSKGELGSLELAAQMIVLGTR